MGVADGGVLSGAEYEYLAVDLAGFVNWGLDSHRKCLMETPSVRAGRRLSARPARNSPPRRQSTSPPNRGGCCAAGLCDVQMPRLSQGVAVSDFARERQTGAVPDAKNQAPEKAGILLSGSKDAKTPQREPNRILAAGFRCGRRPRPLSSAFLEEQEFLDILPGQEGFIFDLGVHPLAPLVV